MRIEQLLPVIPVDDMAGAVAAWTVVLGIGPRFVDGDRWAQFDVEGRRLALAGTDRESDQPGVLVKVDDMEEARRRAASAGLEVGPTREGPHELRFTATGPGGWPITFCVNRP